MSTLSFVRISDPIDATGLAAKILADTGKTVSTTITSEDIQATGTISESDRIAIQASIDSYYYPNIQTGTAVIDNPDMSEARHDRSVTQYAAYQGDMATRRKAYVSGVLKNDAFIYSSKTSTVSGVATFYITSDGTSSGTAVYTNVYSDTIAITAYGSLGNYQAYTPTVSGDKKSIIVGIGQITNVLGVATIAAVAANGVDCRLYVMGHGD